MFCIVRVMPWLAAILMLVAATAGASAVDGSPASPSVTITGGADESGHNYEWTLTNHNPSPIVRIEFPHYGADIFNSPDGWQQGSGAEMNLVNVGRSARPGVCWATQSSPGLVEGASARFGMRIYSGGARRSIGDVKVTFASGQVATVSNVELPREPPLSGPWVGIVGAGLIFGLFIFFREWRRRKQSGATPGEGQGFQGS